MHLQQLLRDVPQLALKTSLESRREALKLARRIESRVLQRLDGAAQVLEQADENSLGPAAEEPSDAALGHGCRAAEDPAESAGKSAQQPRWSAQDSTRQPREQSTGSAASAEQSTEHAQWAAGSAQDSAEHSGRSAGSAENSAQHSGRSAGSAQDSAQHSPGSAPAAEKSAQHSSRSAEKSAQHAQGAVLTQHSLEEIERAQRPTRNSDTRFEYLLQGVSDSLCDVLENILCRADPGGCYLADTFGNRRDRRSDGFRRGTGRVAYVMNRTAYGSSDSAHFYPPC